MFICISCINFRFCENRIQEQLAIDRSTYSEDNILHELINDDTLPEGSLPYALALFMYAGVETVCIEY